MSGGVLGSQNLLRLFTLYGISALLGGVILGGIVVQELVRTPDVPDDPVIELVDSAPAGAEVDASGVNGDRVIIWTSPADVPYDSLECTTPWPTRGDTAVVSTGDSAPPGWDAAAVADDSGEYGFAMAVDRMMVWQSSVTCSGEGLDSFGISDDQILEEAEGNSEDVPTLLGLAVFCLVTSWLSLGPARRVLSRRVAVGE